MNQILSDNLTQEYLKEILSYDTETGLFTWKQRTAYRLKVGDIAGCLDDLGYVKITIKYTRYGAHRLAWLYCYGEFPPLEIDHINRNRSDNRIDNLRLADRCLNTQNTNMRSNNSSGYRGVSYYKANGKWKAQIRSNKKWHNLGYHDTPELASGAYEEAKRKLHIGN